MDRRRFLGLAGAGALGATALGRALAAPDPAAKIAATVANARGFAGSVLAHPASACPVDTIVVLMMENRSFDHYLGWLADDDAYLEAGASRYGPGFSVDGQVHQTFVDWETGSPFDTYHLPSDPAEENPYRGCGHPDPGHGPAQGRIQWHEGFLAEHTGNDRYAVGYFRAEDLPTYDALARQATIFDRYHCSLLSSTYPNRLYLQSAQCGPSMDPGLPIEEFGFDWPCIWDRLLAAHVPCATYSVDLPSALFFGPRTAPLVRPFAGFFADAAAGTLPNVVMLDPGYMSGWRTDDHPHGDMRVAQRFVANVVRAMASSPQWHRSALVVTYDEWGGFFDHVDPVRLPDLRADDADPGSLTDFGQAGFRVPTFLVSPHALPGYVDHDLYDHTSILKLIEWRFGLDPLTPRDAAAANLGASLQCDIVSDVEIPPLPELPLEPSSPPCRGQYFQDVPGAQQAEDALLPGTSEHRNESAPRLPVDVPKSAFELAYEAGAFDRLGHRAAPSMSLRELIGQ